MNSHAFIPLAATLAFIPLLAATLLHRPWQRQQGYFILYLVPAVLWSLSDFLLRSDLLQLNQPVLVKVIICMAFWMVIQFHYILSYYHGKIGRAPVALAPLVVVVVLAILGLVPRATGVSDGGITVDYGLWLILPAVPLALIIGRDFYLLGRKRRAATQPAERNQITYLMVVTLAGALFFAAAFTELGVAYAVLHIGNMFTALVLLYATAAHQLLDVGAALRKVLLHIWLTLVALIAYLVLFWLASKLLKFDFDWVVVLAGLAITVCCIMLVSAVGSTLRRAIEEFFMGPRYDHRQKLFELVMSLHNIADLKEFSGQFLAQLCHATGAQNAWLLLPTPDDRAFQTRARFPEEKDLEQVVVVRRDSPLAERLSREKSPLTQKEINILPEFASLWEEEKKSMELTRIELFFPLRSEDRLVGIVAMGRKKRVGSYAYEEIELITYALSSIGPSIEREHVREQLQAKEQSLALVNKLMLVMTSTIDITDAFSRFTEQLGEFVPIDMAAVSLADEEELYILASHGPISSPWQQKDRILLAGTGTEMAMKQQKGVFEPDLVKAHAFTTGEKHIKQGLRSMVYLPLIYGGRSLGSLTLGSRHPDAYNDDQVKLLEELASQITPPIANSQLYAQAREKARLDELTGLFNRRHFDERLREEINRQARYGGAFSLIMLDLDSFKPYNDVYGHPAGDTLLRDISALIKKAVRTSDQAFRYGGDEFAVLLPQTDTDSAFHVAERIRQEISAHAQARSTGVSCSAGISSCPVDGILPEDLVNAADSALYHSKYAGGNRVYISSSLMSSARAGKAVDSEARSPSLAAIYALATAVDAKDHYTFAHSQRVKEYVVVLSQAMGLPPDAVNRLSAAALLHDIGKIGVRDHILTKATALTKEEYEEVKGHPRLAVTIIANVPSLAPCVPAILYHHERYDGTGYPEGLKGEDIPLEARILAVPDCLADMTSERPYRPALNWEEAMEEISRNAGTQFDPSVVQVFVGLMRSGAVSMTGRPGRQSAA
jgi:diguanylate cyclase (GGDEF)-like protein